ncbi:TetR family transcriptional regulator C-terminal domain-containing protein [Streptomyces sp. NPDC056660]|uniref:TetR family transcriptional regulator C-terminal domain-containing protein n=1 Tax=Streptomyces sp. NPDC056660 TaxID=3345897 RepID=UPI0036C3DE82
MLDTAGRHPLERLRTHFEFMGSDTVDSGFVRGCLVGNFGAELADLYEEIRSAVQRGFQQWASHIERVLAEAQESGEVSASLDVSATSLFVLSAWEGALIAARADKSSAPIDAFFHMVFDVVLR